jgi:ribosomal protein L12E/L44/L45/RPP1/RPP2
MTRERLFLLLAALVLIASGWWLSDNTEWVEEDVPRPATGEARDNPVYAFEQIMRRLGMQAEHHEQLDRLPPDGARLVLLSPNWDLVPERATQMRAWVERGGHLVLLQGADWDDTRLESWVPVFAFDITEKVKRQGAKARAAAAARAAEQVPAPAHGASAAAGGGAKDHRHGKDDEDDEDEDRDEAASQPPVFGDVDSLDLCGAFNWNKRLRVKPGREAVWTLTQEHGQQLIRVAQGRGSVTVLNASPWLFQRRAPFGCDHALLLAATVQADPGATVWIYLNEKREALTPWLWHSGWIAIVLGALTLGAALWRAAVRFGPRLAAPPRLRRSISEQVRGMGAYLHRHGRDALLAAQQRALDDAAIRHLRGYARLTLADRAHAVATATGVARDDLYAAMSSKFCTRAELPGRLHLLETARRLLLSPAHTQRLHDERPSQ